MNKLSVFSVFVGGAIVGAACGLLFAPQSGEDTRKKLTEQGRKIADKINDNLRRKGIKLSREDMEGMVDDIADELKPVTD